MGGKDLSNLDLLAWFSEDERQVCSDCGERACVSFEEVHAAFCLNCRAIKIDGMTIELRRV